MSRFLLGPLPQSLAKGRLLQMNIGCGCSCHLNHGIRALSPSRHASSEDWNVHKTSRQQILQKDLLELNSPRKSFRSSSFLQRRTSVFKPHRNHIGVFVSPHLYTSSICDLTSMFSNYAATNQLHTTVRVCKEESKVEKSVKALKEKVEQLEKEEEKGGIQPAAKEEETVVVPATKSLGQRFVAELKHYYHGFRLLFIDIRICSRLLRRVLNGISLTRRERQQMVRTTADLFRLVPFLVFLLVPFMEFLLPVAVKLFPNMLPSTFAEANKELEKRKKNLKLKLEMAKFLQNTIRETALQKKKKKKGSATEEFSQFVEKIRSQGIRPTTKEILKFAKLFEDEITLDNLSRDQLRAVCRVLNVQPIGIDALLRFQLDMRLRQLKADDKMIVKEGIDSLSTVELQSANRARGMRALGVSDERLRAQLQQWLTLHLEERIPTSLLLLSRALYLPETLSTEEQLEATITELTHSAPAATEEVKLKAAELAGEHVDNKTRLEVIRKEEDIIAEETRARQEEEAALEEKARQAQLDRERAEAEAVASVETMEGIKDEAIVIEPVKAEELVDKAPELTGLADEELVTRPTKEEEEKAKEEGEKGEEESFTAKDLEKIEIVLEEIAQQKQIELEVDDLRDLKEEVHEYKEDLEDLKEVLQQRGGEEAEELEESKVAKRLAKKVDRMIHQADSVILELQQEKERYKDDIETIEDQLKQSGELKNEDRKVAVEEVIQKITESRDRIVSLDEMVAAMKDLQKVPEEARLQRIVEVLDEDHDGSINLSLALKVLETLGHENVQLSKAQVTEMVNLLKAEMELEGQERLQEKRDKENKEQEKKNLDIQN